MFQKECNYCHKTFESERRNKKFCSHKCYSENRRKVTLKANEDGTYSRICKRCGTEVISKTINNQSKFCGRCAGLIAREKKPAKRGSGSSAWKGGRRVDSYGYIKLHKPGHIFSDSTNYVREHIYNVVESIGAEKFKELGGCVHHINGIKNDNRLDNLYVCTLRQNAKFNMDLINIAFKLFQQGYITFENGQYSCPLLSDE